ncbi:1-aminocyclopropane-1-carboxylate deaminase/D-cysteine desulfhydrase [Moraxella sp. ZY210820]|uniref:1-aminocyclopropane-1-carboxylate deaminase/D-cysteine desulfhydrase n=1 Tax=unclassified Moraxella TaxID=2685852 RepID=UPI002731DF11|nr:pyridoxal-phosphate dependent enzyme [Moraxella sp. ZY210820]WLF83398.1 pyridoxal-phosphate dependent enzyme [Moraxella sp. ZY210820]
MPVQSFNQPILNQNIYLDIKRLDLIHPYISGNKYFKLKYNLAYAQRHHYHGILSFGGAYSNHILALAYACHQAHLSSIAIIRGEELAHRPLNPILQQAKNWGMQFIFVSRDTYRLRYHDDYLHYLQAQYPNFYVLPEGGHNDLAIKGCQEILTDDDLAQYDYICCAVGSSGTITGLAQRTTQQHLLGFSALKGYDFNIQHTNVKIIDDYCCGGYAKITPALRIFLEHFQQQYHIQLDPIYTGKMMYGIFDLIQQSYFPQQSRILAIHTGGLMAGQYLLKGKSHATL